MAKDNKGGGASVMEKPRTLPMSPEVSVSYPSERETIAHPSYTFQVAAVGQAAAVELSIDREDWRPCRDAVGLWWFDWSGYGSGEHEAVARLRRPDGTTRLSEPRVFEVKLG